jgi:hypothetical protein
MNGYVVRIGKMKNAHIILVGKPYRKIPLRRHAYRILVGKPERKRPCGRPSRGWEDITTDLKEIGL